MLRAKRWMLMALTLGTLLPAQAAVVTLSGANFVLRYDEARLGGFGAPQLVGDSVYFTFNNLLAQSLNGAGSVTVSALLQGVELQMSGGLLFGGLQAGVFGDYLMRGVNSSVALTGSVGTIDLGNASDTVSYAALALSPDTPLTVKDGLSHDFSAGAANAADAGASSVGIEWLSTLTATTSGSSGRRRALIEQKFSGLQLTVMAVPTPTTSALAALGLVLLAWRRRDATGNTAMRRSDHAKRSGCHLGGLQ